MLYKSNTFSICYKKGKRKREEKVKEKGGGEGKGGEQRGGERREKTSPKCHKELLWEMRGQLELEEGNMGKNLHFFYIFLYSHIIYPKSIELKCTMCQHCPRNRKYSTEKTKFSLSQNLHSLVGVNEQETIMQ